MDDGSNDGFFGSVLTDLSGAAGAAAPLVQAIQGSQKTPNSNASPNPGTAPGAGVGGMSSTTIMIIGGVLVSVIGLILILRRK